MRDRRLGGGRRDRRLGKRSPGRGAGREGRRSAAFRAPEISPFTEVAAATTATATTTLRLVGNELAFRTNSFPSLALFFRFPSYEMLGFFGYLFRFLYQLGVQNGSVLFESLVHRCEYLTRNLCFVIFFFVFWFSFWVTGLLRFLLPTDIT